jgi:hypothetical protein
MTTINAEQLLRMLAWQPAGLAIGEKYPEIDIVSINGELGASQQEWRTIWPIQTLYVFPDSAANLYVSSSSILDVGRIIVVLGLDGNYSEITGYGITNGQTQSIITSLPGAGTPLEFLRVNHAFDFTLSLVQTDIAQGDIYIAESTPSPGGVPTDTGKIRAYIAQGESQYFGAIYTVPAGKVLVLGTVTVAHTGEKQIQLRTRTQANEIINSTIVYLPDFVQNFASVTPGLTHININPSSKVVDERTDFSAEAIGTSPVAGFVTISAVGNIIDKKYVKNLRFGAPIPV